MLKKHIYYIYFVFKSETCLSLDDLSDVYLFNTAVYFKNILKLNNDDSHATLYIKPMNCIL